MESNPQTSARDTEKDVGTNFRFTRWKQLRDKSEPAILWFTAFEFRMVGLEKGCPTNRAAVSLPGRMAEELRFRHQGKVLVML